MKARFLLVSGDEGHYWYQRLQAAISSLGTVDLVDERDIGTALQQDYRIVIVDATVVKDFSMLILTIIQKSPKAYIVVVTETPTWTRAREAFSVGAIDYIRKSSSQDEILSDLKMVLTKVGSNGSESSKE